MRKLAGFSMFFGLSVLLAYALPANEPVVLAVLAGTTVLFLPATKLPSKQRLALGLAALYAGSLWWLFYTNRMVRPAYDWVGDHDSLRTVVLSTPEESGEKIRLLAQIADSPYKLYLRLDPIEGIELGDQIVLSAQIRVPEATDAFDFARFYRAKGIFLTGAQTGSARLLKADAMPVSLYPTAVANRIRTELAELFEGDLLGLLSGILTGETEPLSQTAQNDLSASGLSHIVSVSGMHVSFLVGIIARFIKNKKRAALMAIPAILFFVAMTGGAPSAIRAAVMQIFVLFSGALGRDNDPITALSGALLLLLILNPYSIGDVGLQLSFLAAFGILQFSPGIHQAVTALLPDAPGKHRLIKSTLATLSVTLSATFMTAIPAAYYFGRFSLIGPLSNLVLVPFVSLLFAGGAIVVVLCFLFAPAASVFAVPLRLGLQVFLFAARACASVPYASLPTGDLLIAFWIVFLYGSVAVWAWSSRGRMQTVLAVISVVAMLAAALTVSEIRFRRPDFRISVLNVGQGQAIAAFDGSYTMLVDCGGNLYPGAGTVATTYLTDHHRRQIDLLVLTHTHADHRAGLEELMERIELKTAILPDTEAAKETADFLTRSGVEVIPVSRSFQLNLDHHSVRIFRPILRKSGDEEGIAAMLTSGGFDLLITGDLADVSERILVEREDLPDIEVLIAGHHGSRASTTERLLDAVQPEAAIISVGENSFGHPTEETLARLEQRGIEVYRTDYSGTIEIEIMGG